MTDALIAKTKAELAHFEALYTSLMDELDIARNLPNKPGVDRLIERTSWLLCQIRALRLTLANPDPREP